MSVTENIETLFKPQLETMGYQLVYVEYVKEGQEWYLRFFIDRPEGIDLNDCETVSRSIEPILDEQDMIPNQYILEVSSLGLERPLRNEEEISEHIGSLVMVHLYRPVEKRKNLVGILKKGGDPLVIEVDGNDISLGKNNISKIHLTIDF